MVAVTRAEQDPAFPSCGVAAAAAAAAAIAASGVDIIGSACWLV